MGTEDGKLNGLLERGESTVFQGDSRRLKPLLSSNLGVSENAEFVDATVNSPPYANIKDYGEENQIGSGQAYEAYIDSLRMVYSGVYDITAEDGSLWIVINNRRNEQGVKSLQQDVAEALVELEDFSYCPLCGEPVETSDDGDTVYCENTEHKAHDGPWRYEKTGRSWRFENEIIWDKGKSNDERGGFWNVSEYVLVFSKSDKFKLQEDARIYDPKALEKWWVSDTYNYNADGAKYPNVWQIPAPLMGGWVSGNKPNHSAIYPPKLVERILECATAPGDVVLDPFTGTGTTLFVSEAMERRSVGIELNEEYIDSHSDRRTNIATHLSKISERFENKEKRKRQFQQATWALIHHGYPKFLMAGLRTELNHLKAPATLWTELSSQIGRSRTLDWDELELADATEPVRMAMEEATPVTVFVTAVRDAIGEAADGEENSSTDDVETLKTWFVEVLIEKWGADTLVEQLLQVAADDSIQQIVESHGGEGATETYHDNMYDACAEDLLANIDGDESELLQNLVDAVGADQVAEYIRSSNGNLEIVFDEGGDGEGFGSEKFKLGVLVAGVTSLAAATKTEPEAYEELLSAYQNHGKRCGVVAVIVDPDTKYGVPDTEGGSPGVTYHLLLKDTESDVEKQAFERAIEHLRSLPSSHSYNTQKIRKHSLDVKVNSISVNNWRDDIDSVRVTQNELYFYNESHAQFERRVDVADEFWKKLEVETSRWEEKWCKRSWPPMFSPFKVDIRKTASPEDEHHTIHAINDFDSKCATEQDGGQSTLTSYE